MKIMRQGNSNLCFGLFGICFATLGLIYGLYWNSLFEMLLQKILSLRPDSVIYTFWKTVPLKTNVDIYIFNWTNPQEFYNLSTKPRFEQLGPYRFIEKSDKFDIHWHPENASVSYRKRNFYYFDAEYSRGKLSDKIITLNLVSVSAATKVNKWNYFRRKMATLALNMHINSIALETTVDKILFKGNSDILINVAKTMPYLVDDLMPFDKYGYCYQRNGSADFCGKLNIYTGTDDFSKMGKIHTWNYKKRTGVFKSDCGIMTGTTGELQQTNLKVNDSVSYFAPDLCRSLPLDYADQSELNGVPYFKFVGGLRALDNGTLYPENKCYCVNDECVPSGLVSIAPCWYDTPVFISYPHFYQADPIYLNAVDGLNPNKDSHEFYVQLEPRTGLALVVKGRLQINALVEPLPAFRLLKNAPRVFFPLFWVDVNVDVPDELISSLRYINVVIISGYIVTAIMMLVGIAIVVCQLRAKFCQAANFVKFISEKQEQEKLCVGTPFRYPLLNTKFNGQTTSGDQEDAASKLSISSSTAAIFGKDASLSINESKPCLSANVVGV